MKNDLQAGLQNIIDAINNLIEPKLGSLRYDKTFRAKVISDEGNNVYGVQVNGKNYKAVYTGEKIPVGQIVKVKAPLNNFSDIYIETLPGSGSGSAGNYNDLLNKPILNTNNTGTQVPSATETIQGTISLHKVSKTGNYNDLLNKPTLDFIPISEKGATNGVAGLDENKKVSKSNLPTDTVYDNNYVHTDNNFTTAMKNKLDSVEEGAEPNKIEIIQRNGSVLPINNKIVNVEVPTKTSDLTNDNGFISSIPVASDTILGGIKVGENLSITADGVLSAKGGGTTDYSVLLNKPVLNTANTKSLAVDSNETINGIVSLHKISKTGSYEDLLHKPTIPIKTSDLTNNGDGTTGSKYITNTDLSAGLDGKQDKITGGATTIVSDNLPANKALISNANGKVAVSNTTSTELGYLSGARSNLQNQIDAITTEGGQPNVIEVVQENGAPLEITNKTVNVIAPTNLVNGIAVGSLRTIGSSTESDAYKIGNYAFAEGRNTMASGLNSHAEGENTVASNYNSHAEGRNTRAQGWSSHAEGRGTIANQESQHVQGNYNISDVTSLDIVGNGTSDEDRSNAYTLDANGNAWYSGDIYIGSTSGTNKDAGSKKVATEEYVDNKVVTDYDKLTNRPTLNTNITTSQPVSASEIITGKMVLHKISKTGDYNDLNNKLNIMNGSAMGSLRTVGATAEDSKYKLGRYAFAEGGTAIGYKSHTEGAGVTGSFAFTIISGDSTAKTYTLSNVTGLTVGMLYSIQYGNTIARDAGTITAINSSTKTITVDTYKTLGTKDNYLFILQSPGLGDISYDEGEYAHAEGTGVAVGDYSHAEGHNTKALWASSHAEGESTIARGWRSHAEGYGTVANGRNQHVSGTYNIADNRYLVIVGNGSSDSSRSNAYTLDTNGNAWYSGEVYVGSTSGTHKDNGSKKLITLGEIPIASSRILGLVKVGSGLGIGTDGTLNVTGVPVVLYSNNSGSNGTITLSQTVANFSYLEIIFLTDHNQIVSTGKVLFHNGILLQAFPIYSQSGTIIANTNVVYASGTTITRSKNYDDYGVWNSWNNSIANENKIKIIKVLGYK